jgi:MoxR-like ATPase
LVELISQLHAQSVTLTNRLVDAERGRAEAEKESAIIKASLEAAEARLAALQEQHLSDLKAIRDQMEVETGKVRGELADWKARPWWRRLVG